MEWKKGGYIRCLKDCWGYETGQIYQISRVDLPNQWLWTVIDSKGGTSNGWTLKWFRYLGHDISKLEKAIYGL